MFIKFQTKGLKIIGRPEIAENPCHPSPCGSNAQCREINNQAICSCLPNYLGTPPNCRPECIQNSDCPPTNTCINMKCKDPCPGLCGINALCQVNFHQANCRCQAQYTGDPYSQCSPIPSEIVVFPP